MALLEHEPWGWDGTKHCLRGQGSARDVSQLMTSPHWWHRDQHQEWVLHWDTELRWADVGENETEPSPCSLGVMFTEAACSSRAINRGKE